MSNLNMANIKLKLIRYFYTVYANAENTWNAYHVQSIAWLANCIVDPEQTLL